MNKLRLAHRELSGEVAMRIPTGKVFLSIVLLVIIAIPNTGKAFAFWNNQDAGKKSESSVTEVIKVTNERLNKRVEELTKETSQLKEDLAKLQGDIYSAKRDRDQLLDKLKTISQENNKLKEQITYLDAGLVKVDGVRSSVEKENKLLQEKITQLESKLTLALQDETALDITAAGGNQKTATAKKPSSPEQIAIALEQYKKKARELERSLRAALDQEAATSRKSTQEKNKFLQQQAKLKNTVTQLTQNTFVQKETIATLEKLLEETKAKLFSTTKELDGFKKDAVSLHYNLGVILQGQAQWEAAIKEYQKVITFKPNDADAHFNLALIYDTVENERLKARDHYQKYLNIKPDAPDAAKVKERMVHLNTDNGVWGDPNVKGIKEKLGRW